MKAHLPAVPIRGPARTALRLNRMAARAALEIVVHPARSHASNRRAPRTRAYDVVVGMVARSIPEIDASPEPLRAALEALTAVSAYATTRGVVIDEVVAGGANALWVRSPGQEAQATILYLHGGGYVCGSPRTHMGLLKRLAQETHAQVLALDYRLAPEAPYPAALADGWAAYWWLLAQGVAPQTLFLAGDSAGGGLCVALMVAVRDAGLPLPAGALLFSPWVDLAFRGASIYSNAPRDYLNEMWLRACALMYLQEEHADTPLASPLYADLQGLPPLLIQVGTAEMLFDDATRLAHHAVECGVPVELELWENMVHVWQMLDAIEPRAREAVLRAALFMRRQQQQTARPESQAELPSHAVHPTPDF
jgi:acetyl esterase/lipase